MMKIPDKSQFGGSGNIPAKISYTDWMNSMVKSNGCIGCHQLGQLSTRTFPKDVPHPMGKFSNSVEAWFRRIQSGQSGESMFNTLVTQMGAAPMEYFADWTDRIAKGELPHTKPQRPQGVERNIVVTTWEWLNEKKYLHDLIASDRRYPTVNAYGPLYGSAEYSTDIIPVLDPKNHTATTSSRRCATPTRRKRSDRDMRRATNSCSRRPTGVTRSSGTPRRTITTPCSTAKDGCGSRRRCAVRPIRTIARKARTIRRRRSFQSSAPTAISPCSIPRLGSTPTSIPVFRRTICSSVTTPTKRCGPAAAVR